MMRDMKKYICKLFFIITIMSITGCEKREISEDIQDPVPLLIENRDSTKNDDIEKKICENLTSICSKEQYNQLSVYIKDLNEDIEFKQLSKKMQAASLIKLYIAGAAFENYDTVKAYMGTEQNISDCLKKMITVSDNTAANQLVTAIGNGDSLNGMNLINEFCREHLYNDTHIGRLLLESNDNDDNYTSVVDCGKFLSDLYNGSIRGADEIINLMKQQERVQKIPKGVPDNICVANKTGELIDVENDVAIVYLDKSPYILCIMAEDLSNASVVRDDESQLSREVFEFFGEKLNYEQ